MLIELGLECAVGLRAILSLIFLPGRILGLNGVLIAL